MELHSELVESATGGAAIVITARVHCLLWTTTKDKIQCVGLPVSQWRVVLEVAVGKAPIQERQINNGSTFYTFPTTPATM